MKNILNCMENGGVILINDVVKKMIKNYNDTFQYMCLEDEPCKYQNYYKGTTYCAGNLKNGWENDKL